MEQPSRYHLIDGLRGLAVVNMVAYHFLFDVYILYGLLPGWREIGAVRLWQQGICWTFILISGLSWRLSRHRVRNGLLVNACGLIVTAVTVLVTPGQAIWFGVLNLLGCSLLLATWAAPLLRRIPPAAGLIASFLIFLLTREVSRGVISLGGTVLAELPEWLYTSGWLTIFGFPAPGFTSSDYFPLLPWLFLYLTGWFAGRLLLRRPPRVLSVRVPVLGWVGRHSLVIYMIHQPVAVVAAMAVSQLLRQGL